MAELLVRVIDKVNPNDHNLDLQCLKRGDVVAVGEDGCQWSDKELSNPDWKVLYFPGASMSSAESYMVAEYEEGTENEGQVMLRPRAVAFNLLSAAPRTTFTGGDAELMSYQVEKPPIEQPDVFA